MHWYGFAHWILAIGMWAVIIGAARASLREFRAEWRGEYPEEVG